MGWDVSMVNEDVNSMFIMDDSGGGINYEFPKKYNTGNATDAEEDEELPNTGTHDMAIRISTIDEGKQTIMIDYLFDTSKLTAGTWFIYDPDVTAVPVPSAIPSSIPSSVPLLIQLSLLLQVLIQVSLLLQVLCQLTLNPVQPLL